MRKRIGIQQRLRLVVTEIGSTTISIGLFLVTAIGAHRFRFGVVKTSMMSASAHWLNSVN